MKHLRKLMAAAFVAVLAMALCVPAVAFAASITINQDKTYDPGENSSAYKYDAYKIFDATYDSLTGTWTQTNKDAAADIAYTPANAAVAYFMATGNPWISTVQGLTDYFTVTAAADGSGYTVVPTDAYNTTAAAKAVATALKTALDGMDPAPSGDYAGIEIIANGTAVTVGEGYYLIVGQTATNLALVTTDVTIVEKNEYPSFSKEFTDETSVGDPDATDDEATSANDSVQIGDTVSYTLTVVIPSGANQQMVITDTFTSGLDPVLANGVVAVTANNFTGTPTVSAPANGKFTITLSADDVTANAGKTVTFVYEAVVTADAWYQTEINTGELKYGNDYNTKPDKVDSVTYFIELDKKANSETGDDLGGAQFKLLVGAGKTVVNLVELTADQVTAAGKTVAEKTIYYRVADKNDTTTTDTIDMTAKEGDAYKYTKAVVLGLDGDLTYYARETLAPTGFNMLTEDVTLAMNDENHVQPVVNNSGSVLPSTGGIGTTIFYVIGAILVIGAGVVLITKRRVRKEEQI